MSWPWSSAIRVGVARFAANWRARISARCLNGRSGKGQAYAEGRADGRQATSAQEELARGGSGRWLTDVALLEQAYGDEGHPDEHDHRCGTGCRAVSDQREDNAADEDGGDRGQ